MNFKDGSVEFDAEFQGDADPGSMQIFSRNLEFLADYDSETEGLNMAISPMTALEYARIGYLIEPDEEIGLGIYGVNAKAPKWRKITYRSSVMLKREFETPISSYGAVQGILHAWFKEAREPNFQLRELSTDAFVKVFYLAPLYPDVDRAVQQRTTMLMVSGNMLFDRARFCRRF